jgi:hypothetical protein
MQNSVISFRHVNRSHGGRCVRGANPAKCNQEHTPTSRTRDLLGRGCVPRKVANGLRNVVFENCKVALRKIGDGFTIAVNDTNVDRHKERLGAKVRCPLRWRDTLRGERKSCNSPNCRRRESSRHSRTIVDPK